MRNDEVDDQLKTNRLTSTIMIDSGNLMLIGLSIAAIGGPTLYLLIRLITYCQTPTVDDSQPNFELNTRIGCPDGLCYLPMFQYRYYDIMLERLGHFPSIHALGTAPKSYRRKAKGSLQLVKDNIAHFEEDKKGGQVWEIVERLMRVSMDQIGNED
jgi:hypothetical protein